MIFTDYIYIISDNPDNKYQELHDFAQSIRMEKGWQQNCEGRIYYKCFNNFQRMAIIRKGVFKITRKQMMKYIQKGRIPRVAKRINYLWYHRNRLYEGIVRELMQYHDLHHPKIPIKIRKTVNSIKAECWYIMEEKFCVEHSANIPEGRCYVKRHDEEIDLDIPAYIQNKLIYNTTLIPA